MKQLKLSFAILLICMSGSLFAKSNHHNNVSVLSVKRDIFYFKVSAEFIGSHVEVYGPDGELIATQEISHRKAIIDFFFEEAGLYHIVIKKEKEEMNFDFKKSNPSPTPEDQHVVITQ